MAAEQLKAELFSYLAGISVEYDLYNHVPVLTVEEQAKHIGHVDAGVSKNLLLKDKKGRLILVSALSSTKIDLKGLSARLGLGKGGLRFAPDENLSAVLQVPPGCVTPFAFFNSTARNVGLLLDVGFKKFSKNLFHPLSNDATIAVSTNSLDLFLKSVGKTDDYYVDLEAEPLVSKDQPPDLAKYLPSDSIAVESLPEVAPGTGPVKKATSGKLEASKKQPASSKGSPAALVAGDDVAKTAARALSLVLEAVKLELGDSSEGPCIGEREEEKLQRKLLPQLDHLLVMFKNSAYTQGFVAGRESLKHKFGG